MVSGGGGWWISVRAQSRYADVCVQTCRLGATINEQNIGQRTQQWSGCVFDGQQPQQLSLEVCWPLLLQMVVGGDLPCSKEEAASLAGIQLRIEETWGRPQAPVSPDDNTLKTISEDKVVECLKEINLEDIIILRKNLVNNFEEKNMNAISNYLKKF
uniref:Uncharacterized protein n=1 Tax=Rhodnius prolixus TaxID=13249 RepID=T1HYM0_RHOPR